MYGQTCTHVMHEMHLSASTQAVIPPTGISLRERIDAARLATAVAWAMVSVMNFGAWAVPQRNSPSLAKSTGRRLVFYCAFGERSAMAVQAAQDAGLAQACHITGGLDAWKKADRPVEAESQS